MKSPQLSESSARLIRDDLEQLALLASFNESSTHDMSDEMFSESVLGSSNAREPEEEKEEEEEEGNPSANNDVSGSKDVFGSKKVFGSKGVFESKSVSEPEGVFGSTTGVFEPMSSESDPS